MDQSDLTAMMSPITQETADMSDPSQHFAWAVPSFPAPNKDMGDVPVPASVRPELSQRLWDLGFRHVADLQTKWFIPGDHPEGGWLNIPELVDRAKYDAHREKNTNPDGAAEQWQATAEALLGRLDPKLAQRIADMTPEQRAAAAAVQREQLPAAMQRLAQLAETDQEANS